MQLHTQRLTAAAALTPPKPGMFVTSIRVFGGATPGTFGVLFDGRGTAHFPSPSNGTRGYVEYPVNWQIQGTNVPAAVVSFNGGISVVEVVYSDAARPDAPDISAYRGVRFARTDAAAVDASVTVDFDVAPAKPKRIVGYISASAGRATFPSIGSVQFQTEAVISDRAVAPLPCPDLPESNSLSLTVVSDGASTSQYVVYY